MRKDAAESNDHHGFQGFAPDAMDFFRELDLHQTRDWFHANKLRYEALIRIPLGELLETLTGVFAAEGIPLRGDLASSVFRINRDVRFGKDKRPYKTNAGAVLTRDGTKHAQGLVYLQLGPHESFVAAGFYQLEAAPLETFRRAMLARPPRWHAVTGKLASAGLALSREDALVRLPRGYPQDQVADLGDDIRLKSFVVRRDVAPSLLADTGLVDAILDFARASLPLLEFGWATLGSS